MRWLRRILHQIKVNDEPGQNVIDVRDVTFSYPSQEASVPALEEVSLSIGRDDFLGIIGPNGGGKTTLLLMMLGLLKPQGGRVRVFGQPPAHVRRRVGYVPQHARVDLTVPASALDVVLMGRLARSSWGPRFGPWHVEAAMEAMRMTSTDDLARRPVGGLSGGQRQRVLIARALASDAEVLLLDEPTAGVDAQMESGLADLLYGLNECIPIVMVSHDVSFVSSHLKRVACLNRRLTVHEAAEISQDVIAEMYHGPVRIVHHTDSCPISGPAGEEADRTDSGKAADGGGS